MLDLKAEVSGQQVEERATLDVARAQQLPNIPARVRLALQVVLAESGSARERLEQAALAFLTYVKDRPDGFAVLLRDAPLSTRGGDMPALLFELADRVGGIFAGQFKQAGFDPKATPIYAHVLVGMVAFVGHWWTDARKPPPVETVASHLAALAWMGLRHLPRRPAAVDRRRAPQGA